MNVIDAELRKLGAFIDALAGGSTEVVFRDAVDLGFGERSDANSDRAATTRPSWD